ncbi:MAG TPA: glycosyltransferase [Bacteroidota bacterium]|nr:glycosyltransferase [Bacteroidota bacterium]
MHVYWFSPIRYDYLHQRPQKLVERFLAMNIPVTYVQPTGVRDLRSENSPIRLLFKSLWYHVLAFLSAVMPSVPRRKKPKELRRPLSILSLPVTIPANQFNSRLLEALNAGVYRAFLHREILCQRRTETTIAVFENPFWGRVLKGGEFDRICYDCLDDVSIYAGHASLERFNAYEQNLLDMSDVVVTTAEKLHARLREKTSKPVHRIPNGVDADWFRTRAEACGTPADLRRLARPIVGYVGSIASWLDYDLIREVARLMKEVSFVFVGPAEHQERVEQLCCSPNIHWLGRKPYEDVPAYIKGFDACMIPFRKGEIAETTNPVKVFEYFALGKPVVSTPLRELKQYQREELVYTGDSPAAFADALRRGLTEGGQDKQTARLGIAATHSWQTLARSFLHALGAQEGDPT